MGATAIALMLLGYAFVVVLSGKGGQGCGAFASALGTWPVLR